MAWAVRAVQLPDGDRPVDLWVDAAGCLITEPVPGAERFTRRYVVPGLVDAHAHPAVGREAGMPVALDGSEALDVLASWAACGVCLVRDTGSAGGSVLQLDLVPGMPRLQAAGRLLAPAGRYFPVLLPEAAPQERLTELAEGELARGGRWVKVIAGFPPVTDGLPSGPPVLTYSREAVEAMVAAVHAAGGRVAAHVTTQVVSELDQDDPREDLAILSSPSAIIIDGFASVDVAFCMRQTTPSRCRRTRWHRLLPAASA